MAQRKNNAGYNGTRITWIVGWMSILHVALQDTDFVTCSRPASAYIPLSCRFREQCVHWHCMKR